jgi:hypothetical protein
MSFKFQNIRVYCSTVGAIKRRAAIAIPGIGIFIHPADINNTDLLRHEFGHILQRKKFGFFFFFFKIATASINSARKANKDPAYNHMHCWTEWTANKLSYDFFNCPIDWNFKDYPIVANANAKYSVVLPKKVESILFK